MHISGGIEGACVGETSVVVPDDGPRTRPAESGAGFEEREDVGETSLLLDPSEASTSETAIRAVDGSSEAVPEVEADGDIEVEADGDIEVDVEAGFVPEDVHQRRPTRSGLWGIWDRFIAKGAGSSGGAGMREGVDGLTESQLDDGEDDIEKQGPASCQARTSSNSNTPVPMSSNPVCLICLEPLSEADFESGEAMALECGCRGDLAARHRECAIKWSQVKDDGRGGLPQCELCRQPVKNLPELPRRPERQGRGRPGQPVEEDMVLPMTIEEAYLSDPSQFEQFVPSRADVVFDCMRVTWIAMIVSILFFDANMGLALVTGFVAGMAYLLMLRILYKQHFEAMRAYAEAQRTTRMIIRI